MPSPDQLITSADEFQRLLQQAKEQAWSEITITRSLGNRHFAAGAYGEDCPTITVVLPDDDIFAGISELKTLRQVSVEGYYMSEASARRLTKCPSITSLRLPDATITEPTLVRLSEMTNISELFLDSNSLNMAAIRAIGRFPALTLLSLSHCQLGTREIQAIEDFQSLSRIRDIRLSGNDLSDPNGLRVLARLTGLERLELSFTGLTSDGMEKISHLKNLQYLNISSNKIGDHGFRVIDAFRKSLRSLHASSCAVTEAETVGDIEGLEFLNLMNNKLSVQTGASIGSMSWLKELYVSHEREDFSWSAQFASMSTLRKLYLSGCPISAETMESFGKIRSLSDLHISGCRVTDVGLAALSKESKLRRLDASNNPISERGFGAISEIASLKEVWISGATVSDESATLLSRATQICLLGLGRSRVSALGAQKLSCLQGLERLALGSTTIGDDGVATLHQLPRLHTLEVESCGLSADGARHISKILTLKYLNLSRNKIGPEGAKALVALKDSLERLELVDSEIGDDGMRALGSLSKLRILQVPKNDISHAGAQGLARLRNLSFLDLGQNHIGDVGAAHLSGIGYLERLNIPGNSIGDDGACSLSHIKGLQELSASQNRIGDRGVSCIADRATLTHINLSHNSITKKGAEEFARLPRLISLNLEGNMVGDEGAISICRNASSMLHALHLAQCGIGDSAVPAISQLVSLHHLDLSRNSISDAGIKEIARSHIVSQSKIRYLRLSGNPVRDIPSGVISISDGPTALAAYQKYLDEKIVTLNEMKVIVIGDGGVGKTTIIKAMTMGGVINVAEKSTVGINIVTWDIHQAGIRVNFWDFGGQDMYYDTHKFFLTTGCVYVVVLNDRQSEEATARKWLDLIRSRGGGSPVVVVTNKCDGGEENLRMNETQLRIEYVNIVQFCKTSCTGDAYARASIAHLREVLTQMISDCSGHLQGVPSSWLRVRSELLNREGQHIIRVDDFRRICESQGIFGRSEQDAIVKVFHNLGQLSHMGAQTIMGRRSRHTCRARYRRRAC